MTTAAILRIGLAGRAFGLPVGHVRDVLFTPKMTRLPRAPPGVAGALNLRGKVVVAIDPRTPLGLDADAVPPLAVVVAHGGDAYALLADEVAGISEFPPELFAALPGSLSARWSGVAEGVFTPPGELVVVLSVAGLIAAIGGLSRAAQPNA